VSNEVPKTQEKQFTPPGVNFDILKPQNSTFLCCCNTFSALFLILTSSPSIDSSPSTVEKEIRAEAPLEGDRRLRKYALSYNRRHYVILPTHSF